MKLSAPRGTRDLLPEESYVFRYIVNKIIGILQLYNYQEIQTPIFESAELFQRAVGDDTDIVEKEMYIFKDKGNRVLTLRPEGTAAVVRSFLQNSAYFSKQKINKLFYTGPMFRYERPQTGRYRQFHQIGVEALGTQEPLLDAEVMIMGIHILRELGFDDVSIAVHSVGCEVCRPVIREQLKAFVESILPNLCEDCQKRFEKNPLRILDCKKPGCQTYFTAMPEVNNALCTECKDHFASVQNILEENNVPHEVDSRLVRGLDYYTKTVFEIRSSLLGAQNAICGGGRYDNLISDMGGRRTPAFGFAFGLDRLYIVSQQLKLTIPTQTSMKFFVIGLGVKGQEKGFALLDELRKDNIVADFYYKNKSLGDGVKQAINRGAMYAIIIGEDECNNKTFTIKDLSNREQFSVDSIDAIKKLGHNNLVNSE